MDKILKQQQHEITEHFVYTKLAQLSDNEDNKAILLEIANQELEHYQFWKGITGKEIKPIKSTISKHIFLAKVFGLSFSLRLLEAGEVKASLFYDSISKQYPQALKIKEDELQHEQKLIDILFDYRLTYAGAIVLGLNDALVEFTGTLAGLTFAFQDNMIIGTTGLVMGVAASLSMAASGYLSSREDNHDETNPITSALYTGIAYLITVALLVFPYLIQDNPYLALGAMLIITVIIIALYTWYISIAKNIKFKRRFIEMAAISIGVAAISFGIGMFIKHFFNI